MYSVFAIWGHLSEVTILMATIISPSLGEVVKEKAREYKENLLACVK